MKKEKKIVLASNYMLIIAAAIWGSNFVFQKIVATDIGPFFFMSARSLLGSLTLLPIILCKGGHKEIHGYIRPSFLKLLKVSALCGCINVSGSVMVQIGLVFTDASKAGFLNAIYIIFVPVLGLLFFKKKSSRFMWLGIFLAGVGLYFLCLDESLIMNPGDIIILSSTLCFSLHIQLISKYVQQVNGMHLACLEFFCAFLFCGLVSLVFEDPSIAALQNCLPSILFAGIFGIGICYGLQVTAQKYTDPTVAALLMSLESVFGALGGILILGESFTWREVLGVLLIIVAIVIAQLPAKSTALSPAKK